MTQEAKDLKRIREMMERSSKFRYINGLSVVFAGLAATLGTVFLYVFLKKHQVSHVTEVNVICGTMLAILALSAVVIVFFSWRTAKARGEKAFNKPARLTVYNFLLPLIVGAGISIIFLLHGHVRFVFLFSMIFYGLALFNASKFTFHEIHILGLCEIALGMSGMLFLGKKIFLWGVNSAHLVNATLSALLWWTVGFGLLHIVFGLWIYFKHNRKVKSEQN
jgi:hypothetical protein